VESEKIYAFQGALRKTTAQQNLLGHLVYQNCKLAHH